MIDSEYKFREKYRVPSNRLRDYDYSSEGAYFITICTKNREKYFGEIVDGEMRLSEVGEVAEKFLREIPDHFPGVEIDTYVIMPNHVHMIVMINVRDRINVETCRGTSLQSGVIPHFTPWSIGSVINHYKWSVTKYAKSQDFPFAWQPNYHDHIIRDEDEWNRIRQYIADNPLGWEADEDYRE